MSAIQGNLVWFDAITQKTRRFIEQGGNIDSDDFALLRMLLFRAFADLKTSTGAKGKKAKATSPKLILKSNPA
jgi:hypothetical protein